MERKATKCRNKRDVAIIVATLCEFQLVARMKQVHNTHTYTPTGRVTRRGSIQSAMSFICEQTHSYLYPDGRLKPFESLFTPTIDVVDTLSKSTGTCSSVFFNSRPFPQMRAMIWKTFFLQLFVTCPTRGLATSCLRSPTAKYRNNISKFRHSRTRTRALQPQFAKAPRTENASAHVQPLRSASTHADTPRAWHMCHRHSAHTQTRSDVEENSNQHTKGIYCNINVCALV